MKPAHYVVMGVSGSGKSAVAAQLGAHLDLAAVDADDLHPETNITKMAACVPLTDADRVPWLESLVRWMDAAGSSVVACSALKRSYRDILRRAQGDVVFIHLVAPRALIASRMEARIGHFMPPLLLDSQLNALELLEADEWGIVVENTAAIQHVVDAILAWIAKNPAYADKPG